MFRSNLPPTTIAKPLSARKTTSQNDPDEKKKKKARKPKALDDTPKAFARLMQFTQTGKGRQGLDDGNARPNKKRKRGDADTTAPASKKAAEPAVPLPKILPGERMSEFSARVNQMLPITGISTKGVKVEGMKERRTKKEKKMHRMYAEWREQEARRKEKLEEAKEKAEEEEAEEWEGPGKPDPLTVPEVEEAEGRKSKRKRRSGGAADDDDPWAVLNARAVKPRLHDVAQAPPEFKKIPKEVFKVKNGAKVDVANVPSAAGSLRTREALGDTRKSIIESYRQMMQEKRKAA